jgi:hypothetical protein
MTQLPAKGIGVLGILLCALFSIAHAADPLPAATQLVAASGAAPPTQLSFSIASTEDLVVTLTDLQIPAPLVSAGIVVTQAGAIAASTQLAAPAASATASLPAANGNYTLYVFGVPNTGFSVGTFTACVAPKAAPSNCIQSASLSGNITVQSTASDPTVSTLSTNLSVTTAGSYTFTFADLQFPVALHTPPSLALFQGSVAISLGITTGSAITLNQGTYQLLAIAQADQTVRSGLYSITIAGPAGSTPLLDTAVPVGLTNAAMPFNNPSAQNVTLTVTDYGFPGPLASASALLTAGGTVVGTASAAGGAATVAAPAGTLNLWTYGSAGTTAGTYSADVAGSTDLYTTAQGVGPSGSAYAYAFVTPTPLAAGAYQATVADLQFPSPLTGLSFAVAQNGRILQQTTSAATINFNAVAGNAILLVGAQAPASGSVSGNGLFDVNLQATGASQLIYDKTQSVSSSGALFDAQTLTLGVSANFNATLTDLKFPTAFDNLALVISHGSQILGHIYGGGTFSFSGSPGSYQMTFIATPSAAQLFGLYATSVVFAAPTVTLSSNVSTASTGSAIQLSWSSTSATSCTASGGAWTGSKATNATSESVVLSATTTYTLTCTGTGGVASQSVTVTATPKTSSGGGGSIDAAWLLVGSGLLLTRMRRAKKGSG